MKRLGYERFVAQGGDWGGIVVDVMAGGRADPAAAEPAPPELLGIHTNFAGVVPPELFIAAFDRQPGAVRSLGRGASTYEQLRGFFGTHVAYGLIMGTRPQTLYGLADSPIDLAAFMLDHGDGSGQPGIVQQVLEDRLERPSDLTRDDILDNITLFWLTNTGVSSARLYWENKLPFFAVKGVTVPVGVSTFADEIYQAPRSWAEQAYPNLVSLQRARPGRPLRRLGAAASCSPKTCARRSDRCASDDPVRTCAHALVRRRDRVAQLRAARPRRAAGPRRPRELLDADVHQLAAPGALRPRVVAGLPDDGLIVIGVHTPEFSFEHEIDLVQRAIQERGIDYPVAIDNDYAIWNAFANRAWPALYFVDTDGMIRDRHFGEGRYEKSERRIQRLLGISASSSPSKGSASRRRPTGITCARPRRISATGAARPSRLRAGPAFDEPHVYELPERLRLNHWALAGEWTIAAENIVLDQAGGSIAFRFHARDAHLVLCRGAREPILFRVLLDGEPPGRPTASTSTRTEPACCRDCRMYQLVREHDAVRERTLEITFLEPGAEAYAFTFG